jgi:hypothetical protein
MPVQLIDEIEDKLMGHHFKRISEFVPRLEGNVHAGIRNQETGSIKTLNTLQIL